MTHGTRAAYQAGCPCLPCRAANAEYVRRRRLAVLYPDPGELVDASLAAVYLLALRGQGVGYRQAAKLAGLDEKVIRQVRTGKLTRIKAETLTRILGIRAVLAHGQSVMGWRTRHLLDALEREGYTRARLAAMLGLQTPKLQLHHRRVRVLTALKVLTLFRRETAEGTGDLHGQFVCHRLRCALPDVRLLRPERGRALRGLRRCA